MAAQGQAYRVIQSLFNLIISTLSPKSGCQLTRFQHPTNTLNIQLLRHLELIQRQPLSGPARENHWGQGSQTDELWTAK